MEAPYERLTCTCLSEEFTKHYHLKWKASSGTIEENAGYACARCKTKFVSDRAIREIKIKQKERELAELGEEIVSLRPAPDVQQAKQAPAGASAKT